MSDDSHASLFNGPAFVPGIDLINHSFREPNVAVALVSTEELRSEMEVPDSLLLASEKKCPFYVVALATRELQPGEELHYHYVEPSDADAHNELFWALRFHFVPQRN